MPIRSPEDITAVCVGYCHGDLIHAHFHDSLTSLISQRGGIGGVVSVHSGTRIATSRNDVVRNFLDKTSAEWLWMVDTDMAFDATLLDEMLDVARKGEPRGGEIPILGALAFSRGREGSVFPVAFRLTDDNRLFRIANFPDALIEVAATGAACILIRRDVLEKMAVAYPEPYPWFEETSRDGGEIGEDVAFCLKAREMGFPIFIDTRLYLGHVKSQVVDREVYKQFRVEAKKKRRRDRRS